MRASGFAAALLAISATSLLAACGDRPAQKAQTRAEAIMVSGAGATFPAPLYKHWIEEYAKARPDLSISYDSVGSGEGVKRFLKGATDFGASDAAMSDEDLASVSPDRGTVMIPMTAGMVVLAYNIPGVPNGLTLARDVYIDIFAGNITAWNDARIMATNPGLKLPAKPILTVVRRDSAGTTFAFTNHLSAASPWWKEHGPGIGKLINWPSHPMTAVGNEGVAQRVKITDGAIGYMGYEFAARIGLPMASLYNKAGEAVAPTPDSGRAALASVTALPADLRVFIPDPDGAGSYPIVTYTWVLLNEHYRDPRKAGALKDALGWGLGDGQTIAPEMGYIPLPEAMVAKATEALRRVR